VKIMVRKKQFKQFGFEVPVKHSWAHHGYSAKHLQENNHVIG